MFSTLQNLTFNKRNEEEVQQQFKEAIAHVSFAVLMCLRQAKAGRKFVFEHPAGAMSWQMGLMNKLFLLGGAGQVNFDFCMFGMEAADKFGPGSARKRTRIVTNSTALLKGLAKFQCNRGHRHVPLLAGRAAACQKYPDEFCDFVCKPVV